MTKKLIFVVVSLLLLMPYVSYAQMSDQAVVNYIAEGVAKGKSKTQIGNELIAKGVTAAQAKRLMEAYKNGSISENVPVAAKASKSKSSSKEDSASNKTLDKGAKFANEQNKNANMRDQLEEGDNPTEMVDSLNRQSDEEKPKIIFGHDIFNKKYLSFEPNQNMATPSGYVLGPGDEIRIDVFGMNEESIEETISAEGRIIVENVGPVTLSGLTIEQAVKKLKKVLSSKYSLEGSGAQSDLIITLTNIRTIQVNVLGEVNLPGTFMLSSLSNVMNALYNAGGVTPIGSLRNIKLVRNGKLLTTVDLYKVLFEGKIEKSWSLKDGDIVIVPTYEAIVNVSGGVKRPMLYESLPGEAISHIIQYAGGFSATSFYDCISVQRQNGNKAEVFTVKSSDYAQFGVQDGDVIKPYVNNTKEILANKVTLEGFVLRPGVYELGGEIATVKQLISHAGGLLDGAFRQRAQLIREKEDRTLELHGIAIGSIIDGTSPDILLRKHDVVIVSSVLEMEKKGDVEINGYVTNPGAFKYAEGMTIEDLILLAGGLEEGASSVCVEVGRRILVKDSMAAQDTIARVFTCNIEGDLSVSGDSKFVLMPNDVVSVRKNPTFVPQRKVLVSGEVNFPGTYTLVINNERLSDVIKKAGGTTKYANIAGASLKRKVSEYERNVRRNMVNLVKQGAKMDSLQIEKLKISETYTVGISLEKALANPGLDDDVILQDGDEIIIPNRTNTVRVQGEVHYPNAVNYISGQTLKYYINQSGGWTTNAKRNKTYVVYMNGKVSVGRGSKVLPGSEVVVPSKPEKKKMTTGEWVGIGTAAASMAASIASVITLIVTAKK